MTQTKKQIPIHPVLYRCKLCNSGQTYVTNTQRVCRNCGNREELKYTQACPYCKTQYLSNSKQQLDFTYKTHLDTCKEKSK